MPYKRILGQLLLNFSPSCQLNTTKIPVLCRNNTTGELYAGDQISDMMEYTEGSQCKNGTLASPQDSQEVISAAVLLDTIAPDGLWISLKVNGTSQGAPNWSYYQPTEKPDQTKFLIAIVGITIAGVVAVVLLLIIVKKLRPKKSLYNEFDSTKNPSWNAHQSNPEVANDPRTSPQEQAQQKFQQQTSEQASSKHNQKKLSKNLVLTIKGGDVENTGGLRFEDVGPTIIEHDNLITNLDNHSPKSVHDAASVKSTPKNVDFNVEFSMIEQDSKIKTDRYVDNKLQNDDD